MSAIAPTAPPHSVDAEAALVGAMIGNPRIVQSVLEELEPAHLYSPSFRLLFEGVQGAHYADTPIDPLTITEPRRKALASVFACEESAAVRYVQELAGAHKQRQPEAVMEYARIVRRHADMRALLDLASQIQASVAAAEDAPDAIAGVVSQTAMEIATGRGSSTELVAFGELGRRYIRTQQLLMAAAAAGLELGVYTGLQFLDSFTRGVRPGELFFLAGEPGAGKSAVSWKAAQGFAERQAKVEPEKRIGTLLFSLEMGEEPSAGRFAQSISALDGGKLREGRIDQAELGKLVAEWRYRKDLPLYTNFSSNLRLSQVRALVAESVRRHNVGLVVIDHWKYLQADQRFRDPNDEDEAKARFLKQDIAKQLNVAVMCLGHTTKGAANRDDKRPRMADLRGSGWIAAHADWLAFVHRPFKHATPEQIDEGAVKRTDAELIWEKTRHGGEGVAEFYFDPATMYIK